MLENRVLLRSTQIRPAGLQVNRTRLAAQRGKSKRHGSAPRHLRSALKADTNRFLSPGWLRSDMYPNRGFWIHVSIFLVLDTSTCPYVSAIRCAITICIYTVWGHFGELLQMQPLERMCYRRHFQNKVTAAYHCFGPARFSGKELLVQSSKCFLM